MLLKGNSLREWYNRLISVMLWLSPHQWKKVVNAVNKCTSECYCCFPFFLETCPICLDHITGPRRLKCRHVFCSVCLQKALKVNNKCPVCQELQGVLRGNQPRGEMTSYHESFRSLPGYPGNFKTCLQTTTAYMRKNNLSLSEIGYS